MMFKTRFLPLFVLLFCIQVYAHPGFRQITFSDQEGAVINVAVWYPTSSQGITEDVGENPAFTGVTVIRDALPTPGLHPLLVLSHGYNGNWRNLSWIAVAMAAQGYIVAAPDHPGTTTFNQNPAQAKKLWRRPQDISQVIDLMTKSPRLFGETDKGRIAALGHSLGGWTVMELAGARFDAARFAKDCLQQPLRGDCNVMQKLSIDEVPSQEKLSASYEDQRIRAVVSLDLGFAPGFTPQSMHGINIPVLILAAQMDSLANLSASQESGYLANEIGSRWGKYEIIEGATHFSFMQLCKAGAEALINEGSPGDGIVCQDGNGINRYNIHQKLVAKISAFLNSSLDFHSPADETK
ncbi:alpha/beta hydrolase family protein [Rahnella sikkimica]|uniref:Lipoprotein signal peptide n=1 Tax=Rahnella sikkimica TaxID=1805933 RepID=A0A2L1UXC9_9GAMM|nr:alpha/beta fold hydrolase [Rahnella sikkimica]AVF37616.1 lipoprotein signal peptide [Rahnella sikkimica]